MGKWLVVAGLAILAIMVVLWKQLDAPTATAAPTAPAQPAVLASTEVKALPLPAAAPVAEPTEASPAPQKMDVESDAFFYKFQEVVPAVLSRNAVKCYEGISKRVHRNQSIVLKFKTRIRDGVVTIRDVEIEKNTLENAGLDQLLPPGGRALDLDRRGAPRLGGRGSARAEPRAWAQEVHAREHRVRRRARAARLTRAGPNGANGGQGLLRALQQRAKQRDRPLEIVERDPLVGGVRLGDVAGADHDRVARRGPPTARPRSRSRAGRSRAANGRTASASASHANGT